MTHTSPATSMLWSILSTLLLVFLVSHLWSFDRFKCLRLRGEAGAFKRIMTYTYLLSVPLINVYAIGFAVIKYMEGYVDIPGRGVIPKPYRMWSEAHRSLVFPLHLAFSVAWAFEMVTHLEELCFWLFLVHSGAKQPNWFKSVHFYVWCGGSILALSGMPTITSITRDYDNPSRSEAWTFLAGSLGSLSLTIWFVPVLWVFPAFLRNIKEEGVERHVVVRLCKFHDLNITRVAFRFLFVLPFLALAIDGVKPEDNHLVDSALWTDFLSMLGAIGCVVSSVITLLIFFPRSIETEAGYAPISYPTTRAERHYHYKRRMVEGKNGGAAFIALPGKAQMPDSPILRTASPPQTPAARDESFEPPTMRSVSRYNSASTLADPYRAAPYDAPGLPTIAASPTASRPASEDATRRDQQPPARERDNSHLHELVLPTAEEEEDGPSSFSSDEDSQHSHDDPRRRHRQSESVYSNDDAFSPELPSTGTRRHWFNHDARYDDRVNSIATTSTAPLRPNGPRSPPIVLPRSGTRPRALPSIPGQAQRSASTRFVLHNPDPQSRSDSGGSRSASRRFGGGNGGTRTVEMKEDKGHSAKSSLGGASRGSRGSNKEINPLVWQFTSPIDLLDRSHAASPHPHQMV